LFQGFENGASSPKGLLFTEIMNMDGGDISSFKYYVASFKKLWIPKWEFKTALPYRFAFLSSHFLSLLSYMWEFILGLVYIGHIPR
jgi:hypothetical protein